MKQIWGACLLLQLGFRAGAQELTIGQQLPAATFTNVLNYNRPELRLSDLRGKLLILDFWGTNCIACIEAFPKLEALQQQFGDRLQIVLVNDQDADSTRRFFAGRKKIKMPALPMLTGDTLLKNWFPRNYLPWVVWIDTAGTVRYITDSWNATAENVEAFFRSQPADMATLDYVKDFDPSMPLIAEGNGRWLKKVEYYSFISRCVRNAPAGYANPSFQQGRINGNRLTENCGSIKDLFVRAFSEGQRYDFRPRHTVLLDVRDTFRYVFPGDSRRWDRWYAENSYSYDLLLPEDRAGEIFKVMQQDLVNFFGVTARVEKRVIPCLVLVRTGKQDRLRSKGGEPFSNLLRSGDDSLRWIQNSPFSELAISLQVRLAAPSVSRVVVDATGYQGKVDISFPAAVWDEMKLPALRKQLRRYGLDLVEQQRPHEVLVIRERR